MIRDELQQGIEEAGLVNDAGFIDTALAVPSGIWHTRETELLDVDGTPVLRFGLPEGHENIAINKWGWERVTDTATMLDQFLRVESANQAEKFAKDFGPVFVCATHPPRPLEFCFWGSRGGNEGCTWSGQEAVASWLSCAAQARAAIRILIALHDQPPRNGKLEDYRSLIQLTGPDGLDVLAERCAANAELGRNTLRYVINHVTSTLPWPRTLQLDADFKPSIALGVGFLPAAWHLILQAAASADSIYFCSGCFKPYVRARGRRAPKDRSHNYCDDCRRNNYAIPKSQLHRARKQQLSDLYAHVMADCTGDWNAVRIAWNDKFEALPYADTDDFIEDVQMAANGSYRALNEMQQQQLTERIKTMH